jgi:gamma-D-glutamyl-L-lysine dipeptidyl-peptidase
MDPPEDSQKLIARTVTSMLREPDPLSEQVSQALLAMLVQVLEAREEWSLIRTPDGYEGWAEAAALVDVHPEWDGPWAEVEDLWINLRGQAGFRLAAAAHAAIGTRLPVAGRSENWFQLLMPDGRRLWTEGHRVRLVDREPLRPATPEAVGKTALRFLGIPYLWGGCSPLGLDCSGFMQLLMRLHGISLLRDAHQQAAQGEASEEPARADLVFFGPEERPDQITHVGMMLDRRRFIHAPGGDRIRINRLTDEPYACQFRRARRFL